MLVGIINDGEVKDEDEMEELLGLGDGGAISKDTEMEVEVADTPLDDVPVEVGRP